MNRDVNFFLENGTVHFLTDVKTNKLLMNAFGFHEQSDLQSGSEYTKIFVSDNHETYTVNEINNDIGINRTYEFGYYYQEYTFDDYTGEYSLSIDPNDSIQYAFPKHPEIQSYKDLIDYCSSPYEPDLESLMDGEIYIPYYQNISLPSSKSKIAYFTHLKVDGAGVVETNHGLEDCVFLETTNYVPFRTKVPSDYYILTEDLKAGNYKIIFSDFESIGYFSINEDVPKGYKIYGFYDWERNSTPFITDSDGYYKSDITLSNEELDNVIKTLSVRCGDFNFEYGSPINYIPQNLVKAFYVTPNEILPGKYFVAGTYIGVLTFEISSTIPEFSIFKLGYDDCNDPHIIIFKNDRRTVIDDISATYIGEYGKIISSENEYSLLVDLTTDGFMAVYCNNSISAIKRVNNGWYHSAIRKWLNSAEKNNKWWYSTDNFDVLDVKYDLKCCVDGFLAGLSQDLRNVLVKRKIVSYTPDGETYTSYDSVTLPTTSNYNLQNIEQSAFAKDVVLYRYSSNGYSLNEAYNIAVDPVNNRITYVYSNYGTPVIMPSGYLFAYKKTSYRTTDVTNVYDRMESNYNVILSIGDGKIYAQPQNWGSLIPDTIKSNDTYSDESS